MAMEKAEFERDEVGRAEPKKANPKKAELIDDLRLHEIPENVIRAFEEVDREGFVLEKYKGEAYENHPLPIGHSQTISQPIMIADMLKELGLKPGQKVLEIGAGSGYQAALLKEAIGAGGKVVSVERVPELVELSKANLARAGYDVEVVQGDGSLGYPTEAPYDRIVVSAGAPKVPEPLVEQLKIGGRLVAPVGNRLLQELVVVDVDKSGTTIRKGTPCIFVNLIGEHGWPG